jgi:bacterioferritin-associated ferredoxin
MTGHSTLSISRCVCRNVEFSELLPRARAAGWSLAELVGQTGCGGQCGLCRPYLSRMLRTGQTEFHEILTADDH